GLVTNEHSSTDDTNNISITNTIVTCGYPTHHAYLLLCETDEGTVFGAQYDFFRAVCQTHRQKFVVSPEGDGNLAVFVDAFEILQSGPFDKSVLRGEHKEHILEFLRVLVLHSNHCADFFIFVDFQHVDDRNALGLSGQFRQLIAFQTVHASFISKEHDVIMCAHRHDLADEVILDCVHALYSAAAA